MITKEELEEVIDKAYSLDSIIKIYKDYVQPLKLYESEIKIDQKDVTFSKQKAQKKELIGILADVYSNLDNFKKLLESLPPDVIKVFDLIVWEGGKHRAEVVEKDLSVQIIGTNSTGVQFIASNYIFFNVEKAANFNQTGFQYKIFLPDEIRNFIRPAFSHPEGYELQTLEEIPEHEYVTQDSNSILRKIQLYFNYMNSGNIFYSKLGKPSKVSIKNMHDYCEIKEFYKSDNKDLTYLKTEMVIDLLKEMNLTLSYKPVDSMKEIIQRFQSTDLNFYPDSLLDYIRGKGDLSINHDYKERSIKIRKAFIELLKELPDQKWIDINTLMQFIAYRNLFFKPYDEKFSEENLYFDETKKTSSNYTFTQKTYIKDDLYKIIITVPLLKGLIYLFASIGILDISYDSPKNNDYRQKNEDYLSPYDNLKFIRLSELGFHVLNETGFEQFEVEEEETNVSFLTDDDRLLVSVHGYDKVKLLFLESLSEKLSDNKYKITFTSFINGCNTKEELENRIKAFRHEIAEDLSAIWNDFFNKVLENTECLKKETNIEVFRIKNNKIIDVLTNDTLIKSYVYRIEDYRIAIKTENIPSVKKRLQELGYLFDF